MQKPGQISILLRAWTAGDKVALDKLTPVVYGELRRLARHYLRGERAGHTLQPTALVNEAYMRLADCDRMHWKDRAHFFAVCATFMRRILVDHARRRNLKRGGAVPHVSLDEAAIMSVPLDPHRLALEKALEALAKLDPRKALVVELRYFDGLSVEEVAKMIEISPITVMRDSNAAKAWLKREMGSGESDQLI